MLRTWPGSQCPDVHLCVLVAILNNVYVLIQKTCRIFGFHWIPLPLPYITSLAAVLCTEDSYTKPGSNNWIKVTLFCRGMPLLLSAVWVSMDMHWVEVQTNVSCAYGLINMYVFSFWLREYCECGRSQKEVHTLWENRTRVSPSVTMERWSQLLNFQSSQSHQETRSCSVDFGGTGAEGRLGSMTGRRESRGNEQDRILIWLRGRSALPTRSFSLFILVALPFWLYALHGQKPVCVCVCPDRLTISISD